jgi:S-adenosyl methyltransferase
MSGTGLPTTDNTHEVAQRIDPSCRIVYVDNDPLVLVHARALLTSAPQGVCDYLDADVREPEKILVEAARTLDFSQPIVLVMPRHPGQRPGLRPGEEGGGGRPYIPRTPEQISAFFDGLEFLEPGVVSTPLWRPDTPGEPPDEIDVFCGVGRKP